VHLKSSAHFRKMCAEIIFLFNTINSVTYQSKAVLKFFAKIEMSIRKKYN